MRYKHKGLTPEIRREAEPSEITLTREEQETVFLDLLTMLHDLNTEEFEATLTMDDSTKIRLSIKAELLEEE